MRLIAVLGVAVILTLGTSVAVTRAKLAFGTAGNDVLQGTAENDELYGLQGDDRLNGAAGRDDLDGGAGADDLRGGEGVEDAAGYDGATAVSVTLDDRPDDGAVGEADNIHVDVEHVYTGAGADTLEGSAARNTLDAGAGADRIRGGGGRDALYGGLGDDVLDGGPGADLLDCGRGSADVAVTGSGDTTKGCEFTVGRLPPAGSVLAPAKGSFRLGGGVSQREGCRGKVRMSVLTHSRVLASATVGVDRRCRYRHTFVLTRRRVGTATALDLRARFLGNPKQGARTFPLKRRAVPVVLLD